MGLYNNKKHLYFFIFQFLFPELITYKRFMNDWSKKDTFTRYFNASTKYPSPFWSFTLLTRYDCTDFVKFQFLH